MCLSLTVAIHLLSLTKYVFPIIKNMENQILLYLNIHNFDVVSPIIHDKLKESKRHK